MLNAVVVNETTNPDQQVMYFSDWRKPKRSVAWFLKRRQILLALSEKRKQLVGNACRDAQMENEIHVKCRLCGQSLCVVCNCGLYRRQRGKLLEQKMAEREDFSLTFLHLQMWELIIFALVR